MRVVYGVWVFWVMLGPLSLCAQQTSASKLSQGLQRAAYAGSVRLLATDSLALVRWLATALPTVQWHCDRPGIYTLHNLSAGQLQRLAASPAVQHLDVGPRQPHTERALQVADFNLNRVEAAQRYYPAITGQGFRVSVKEDPFDSTDIDFKGRVVPSAVFALPQTTHASTMATIIGGGGNSGPLSNGVAPAVALAASSFVNLLPDANSSLLLVSTQNHSYGVGLESFYGIEAHAYDQQCATLPHLLHVFSAGNAGTQAAATGPYAGLAGWANLTGQFKHSKNTLSIGATNSLSIRYAISSRGPAHDGRIKPELVAIGDNGTSEAAAMTSGAALLLQHAYFNQTALQTPSYLIKAVLINSADDVGAAHPDYSTGYGHLDALGALQTIVENRVVLDSVQQNQTLDYPITLPAGVHVLRATLCWLDPAAAPNATKALVNDLHLSLLHPASSSTYRPWVLDASPHPDSLAKPAQRGTDTLNNVEHISLAAPTAGSYTLRVQGASVQGRQVFALAYEYENALAWDYPVRGSVLAPGSNQNLRWRGAGTGYAQLHYRTIGQPWVLIADSVALAAGYYSWAVPQTTAPAQLRLTVGMLQLLSDTFLLAQPLGASIGFDCDTQALLQWPALAQADSFTVYRLGAQSLQKLTTVTDTLFVIQKNSSPVLQHAVAPWVGGIRGPLSYTLNYTTQGVGCYVRTFVAEQAVSSTPTLLLQLGSTYQLASVVWQKLIGGTYVTLQTIASPVALSYSFTDPAPLAGTNQYRMRIETQAGEVSYSQIENVQTPGPAGIWAYPNPLQAGAPLNLTTTDDAAVQVRILNIRGAVVWQALSDLGQVKALQPKALQAGYYVLEVSQASGQVARQGLVVY